MGQRASEVARQWFADNRYQDYLYLHGLSVEMAEAMAEYVHKRIRAELGFAAEDDRDMEKMLQPGLSRLALFLRLSGLPESGGPGPALASARCRAHRRLALTEEWQLDPEQIDLAPSCCCIRRRSIFRFRFGEGTGASLPGCKLKGPDITWFLDVGE